ncbi:MAG: DoxX family protein [Kofleriaceae bacterium]
MTPPASVAERIVYGTPVDPATDLVPIRVVPRSATAFIGRVFLTSMFLVGGIAKLTNPAETAGYMHAAGIPSADVLVYVAAFIEILGAISILFGFVARLGALGLAIYLIPVTLTFHDFWNFTGAEQKTQLVNFLKNLTIMGGLLLLTSFGAGRYSIDAALRRPFQA